MFHSSRSERSTVSRRISSLPPERASVWTTVPPAAHTAMWTVPGGLPSAASGPATPVVAAPTEAPTPPRPPAAPAAPPPGPPRPRSPRGARGPPGRRPLAAGGVGDPPAAEARRGPGNGGDRGAEQPAGERLGDGDGLPPLCEQAHDLGRQ